MGPKPGNKPPANCPHCGNYLQPHCQRTIRNGRPAAGPCGWGECRQCQQIYRLADMRNMPERGSVL